MSRTGAAKSIVTLEKEFEKFEKEFLTEVTKDVQKIEQVIEDDEKTILKDIQGFFGFGKK